MYTLRNFGEMVLDAERTDAYARALRATVRPGCVVLDIGTGTGVFALIAARLGARRVFALEPGEAIHVAREIAAANGLADRIEHIQALSTDVTLPERADVIVSDLRGVLPLFGGHLAAIADARARHLVPEGTLIPQEDTLWLGVVEAPEEHRAIGTTGIDAAFGLDMGAARRLVANAATRARFEASQLLTRPHRWLALDYRNAVQAPVAARLELPAARAGHAHGLALWFDSRLAEGIGFSNAPGSGKRIYGHLFLPWPEAVDLHAGDRIDVDLRADRVGGEYLWTWASRVARAGGEPLVAFEQSEFHGDPLSAERLRRTGSRHVPGLGEAGRVDQLVLELMAAGHPVAEIAERVARRFPDRFASGADALSHVGELSLRYGEPK
jgi:protein arginine N-methyltransferase 1